MLTINAITVRLGGRTILDRAAAAIPPGARVGLVGRNGAGKSTLLKALIGEIEPDGGTIDLPRRARLGYVAQEAPAGAASAFDTVLAGDAERAALLAESEADPDPHRLGDIHERLLAIDAYSAPARAGRILSGLGFDEAMQGAALDTFSGGWRMRVALAALLFSAPDVLLLDEPSNHLDLEASLWLEDFLTSYPGTLLVISHERDLLNRVTDHILHLAGGKLTLYPGSYDAFERQRAERAAVAQAARAAQDAQAARLKDYVARNSARASTARQAQSRAKLLAKMQPIAAALEDPTLAFAFPDPEALRPPLVTFDHAAVGYGEVPVLERLELRIDPDERIALLGRNGNGKTTLARLVAGQLASMSGSRTASGRLRIGYFTQYQVEELEADGTPLALMARALDGEPQAKVRAQLGRFGFSGDRALARIDTLSGGERARLALALVTRNAPHLLILDEPTNHLDVDAREALVQALNAYAGAVILISHDRHMVELTADRLVLVEDGAARDYPGSVEDYIALVLSGGEAKAKPAGPKRDRQAAAAARGARAELAKRLRAAETAVAAAQAALSAVDRAMFAPASAAPALAALTMGELSRRRAALAGELASAEAAWLDAEERLDAAE